MDTTLRSFIDMLGRGRRNAQTSDVLAKKLGTEPERTNLPIRDLARAANKIGVPVVSGGRGFFIASTQEELEKYKRNLRGRAEAELKRIEDLDVCVPWAIK